MIDPTTGTAAEIAERVICMVSASAALLAAPVSVRNPVNSSITPVSAHVTPFRMPTPIFFRLWPGIMASAAAATIQPYSSGSSTFRMTLSSRLVKNPRRYHTAAGRHCRRQRGQQCLGKYVQLLQRLHAQSHQLLEIPCGRQRDGHRTRHRHIPRHGRLLRRRKKTLRHAAQQHHPQQHHRTGQPLVQCLGHIVLCRCPQSPQPLPQGLLRCIAHVCHQLRRLRRHGLRYLRRDQTVRRRSLYTQRRQHHRQQPHRFSPHSSERSSSHAA